MSLERPGDQAFSATTGSRSEAGNETSWTAEWSNQRHVIQCESISTIVICWAGWALRRTTSPSVNGIRNLFRTAQTSPYEREGPTGEEFEGESSRERDQGGSSREKGLKGEELERG